MKNWELSNFTMKNWAKMGKMLRFYHEELEVNMVLTLNHQTRGCVVCHWIGVREIYTGNLYTGNLGCHLEIRAFQSGNGRSQVDD